MENLDDPALDRELGSAADQLREDVELVEGVYEPFALEEYRAGRLAPVFFGSAITNFGVQPFLEGFIDMAPSPAEGLPSVGTTPQVPCAR